MTNDDINYAVYAKKFVWNNYNFECSKKMNIIGAYPHVNVIMMTNDDKKTPKNALPYLVRVYHNVVIYH